MAHQCQIGKKELDFIGRSIVIHSPDYPERKAVVGWVGTCDLADTGEARIAVLCIDAADQCRAAVLYDPDDADSWADARGISTRGWTCPHGVDITESDPQAAQDLQAALKATR